MNGYNQLSEASLKTTINKIKTGSFRYCPWRSGGCIRVPRWPRYEKFDCIRVDYEVARRSAFGKDCSGPWIKISMGNIIPLSHNYDEDTCTEFFSEQNPLFSNEGLKIKICGSVYDVFGFKFHKVKPEDKRYSQVRTADYSTFIVKFYIDESIEDMFRRVKRNSYNPAKLSREDLTYKKNERGDYFISMESRRYTNRKVYLGRVWSSGGGWFYENFLHGQRSKSKPFQTRKKANESLYQELRA